MGNDSSVPATRLRLLAESFSTLCDTPGVSPWEAAKVDDWAAIGSASCAAKFLLTVWNPDAEWRSGRFDLMEASSVFDADHRRAFLEWAKEPW